ncbi:MAG: glycosyltransferase family 4 protein [Dyadobacter sp.]|uniref:glycosyltransferase family 4 protein n=1 Tax=Dyadobacter sp. TaxID=1914288 RepID=UPI001B05DD79|nr:glycosyltransferase family 1 protein [Dyadobacter sp.]MBO9616376.1 glycosyltransferase family 4 protein [Dyadobacter sp.]
MNSLKIFVDGHVFDKEHQGTKTFIRELYKQLIDRPDIEIFIAAQNTDTLQEEFGKRSNLSFIKYRSKSPLLRLSLELPYILKKIRPDYAHFQYVVPPIKFCKYIVTTHDLLFKDFPGEFPLSYRLSKDFLFKNSIKISDVITTVSEYSREAISRHYGLNISDISVIPNGVGSLYFEPYDKRISKQKIQSRFGVKDYILYVSRIEPRKQQKLLISAYLDLKLYNRGISLVFIGHESIVDPEFNNLINSVPEDYRPLVKILKNISDEDLMEFYRAAELFVYPSSAEGFGIPPLESAALKIPTISTNATAMQDFTFFDSFHVNADRESITQAVKRFIEDKDAISSNDLSNIQAQIRQKYSWKTSAERLVSLLKK